MRIMVSFLIEEGDHDPEDLGTRGPWTHQGYDQGDDQEGDHDPEDLSTRGPWTHQGYDQGDDEEGDHDPEDLGIGDHGLTNKSSTMKRNCD